jgi:cysteine dioxygenase
MAHPLRTSVEDFIAGLKTFERDHITKERVREYMESAKLSVEALRPYTFWRDSYYTRNLIYKDDKFEVMSICWKPGQKTVVHTHNGALGWMTVPQGEVSVHNYHYAGCNAPENMNVVGMDCLAGATHIDLERLHTDVCAQGSPIYCVDKFQTIHQIENLDEAKAGVVSLHVYSPPIESCVQFDLDKQRCSRKTLTYYSRYGKVEVETDDPNPLRVVTRS